MNDDPREAGPRPPYPSQQQQPRPGLTSKMPPLPDHGEASYVGKGLLAGKVALITGGDSGIGRAVAIAYAREGADVAISYLDVEESDAQDTRAWVEKPGDAACSCPATCATRHIAGRSWRRPWTRSAASTCPSPAGSPCFDARCRPGGRGTIAFHEGLRGAGSAMGDPRNACEGFGGGLGPTIRAWFHETRGQLSPHDHADRWLSAPT